MQENAAASEIKLTAAEVQALNDELDQVRMSQVFGGSAIVKS